MDLRVRGTTIKILGKSIGLNLYNFTLSSSFMDMTPEA